MQEQKEQVKLIFTAQLARALLKLKKNYMIVDVKPDKNNNDKTVFVFRNDVGLKEDIQKLTINNGKI